LALRVSTSHRFETIRSIPLISECQRSSHWSLPLHKSKSNELRDDHTLKGIILPSGSVHRICKPICVIY